MGEPGLSQSGLAREVLSSMQFLLVLAEFRCLGRSCGEIIFVRRLLCAALHFSVLLCQQQWLTRRHDYIS